MKCRLFLFAIVALLLMLAVPEQTSFATPGPPYVMVNETTRQCYISILDDECNWCEPPAGWVVLGNRQGGGYPTECPEGFTKIDQLELSCKGYKQKYCCGVFSSQGDCEDMVKNATEQACAFVDDIHACILPEGWYARPTEIVRWGWTCNFNQAKWVDDVACLTATQTPSAISLRAVTSRSPVALPAAGIAMILLGGGTLAFLLKKR